MSAVPGAPPATARPDYSIERLQTHCYLLLRHRVPIGRLERLPGTSKRMVAWQAVLSPPAMPRDRPTPFTEDRHQFRTFAAASHWLGLRY